MKCALITGGSRGIGAELVRSFCGAGYRTAFFYCSHEGAARELARETGACALRCDVSDPAQVRQAVGEVLQSFRHIDVLVNNAGIAQQKLITDVTDEDWQRMSGVNLSGTFYTLREVLPGMISRKQGRVINISSIWGQVGASCEAHYSAVKAGVIGLTKAAAKEAAPSGVTVNCVCPGVIETDMLGCFTAEEKAAMAEETPAGRLGTPRDVAAAVMFFASEEAGFITGQVLGVNGGFGE